MNKLPDRIEKFIEYEPMSGCWLWSGSINDRGRATIYLEGKNRKAARVIWELFNGPITNSLHVLHTCDNTACVNPKHLFLGTHRDNMLDKVKKGRHKYVYGEDHSNSKLTDEIVKCIKTSKKTHRQLAKSYGVAKSLIQRIKSGQSWKHIN